MLQSSQPQNCTSFFYLRTAGHYFLSAHSSYWLISIKRPKRARRSRGGKWQRRVDKIMPLHQHSSQSRKELVPSALSKTLRQSNTGEAAWRLVRRMDSYIGQFLIKPTASNRVGLEYTSLTTVETFLTARGITNSLEDTNHSSTR